MQAGLEELPEHMGFPEQWLILCNNRAPPCIIIKLRHGFFRNLSQPVLPIHKQYNLFNVRCKSSEILRRLSVSETSILRQKWTPPIYRSTKY